MQTVLVGGRVEEASGPAAVSWSPNSTLAETAITNLPSLPDEPGSNAARPSRFSPHILKPRSGRR